MFLFCCFLCLKTGHHSLPLFGRSCNTVSVRYSSSVLWTNKTSMRVSRYIFIFGAPWSLKEMKRTHYRLSLSPKIKRTLEDMQAAVLSMSFPPRLAGERDHWIWDCGELTCNRSNSSVCVCVCVCVCVWLCRPADGAGHTYWSARWDKRGESTVELHFICTDLDLQTRKVSEGRAQPCL